MFATLLALAAAQAPAHTLPPRAEGQVQAAPTLRTCPVEGVIPRELAGWRQAVPVAADRTPVTIGVGRGVRATLLPTADVTYPVAPARAPAADTSGGVFAFEVAKAGRYRVALGAGAWIDVVHNGRVIASRAHGHGPECSPVRKMVDFDLAAGRYLLEVAGSPAATLSMMIAPL